MGLQANIHLINWGTVTKGKAEGGLDIRRLKDMNVVFLVKMGWRLLMSNNALWAKTITAKYLHSSSMNNLSSRKQRVSNLWKGICNADSVLKEGIRKTVRFDKDTSFWFDRWICSSPPIQLSTDHVNEDETMKKVAEYWVTGLKW